MILSNLDMPIPTMSRASSLYNFDSPDFRRQHHWCMFPVRGWQMSWLRLCSAGRTAITSRTIGGRVPSKGVRRLHCHPHGFEAFASSASFSNPSTVARRSKKPINGHYLRGRSVRQLATGSTAYSDELIAQTENLADDEAIRNEDDLTNSVDLSNTEHSTPWYLQVDPPERESVPLSQRQKLPDTPSDSPPLLQPILEHVFIDLGLDDVTLFDLRDVDPPPALGANLMMVICTARSEKHLHVSADKFCQWMKTTHQITPYADGLLGRGELKLKLKRKAKRARILSRVGASETKTVDDGIRTGWICVTVENLEDGRPISEMPKSSDDFIGFGSEEGGAKVVIQMLTQDKREELDLEDLWGKTMRRHDRRLNRIQQGPESASAQQEVGRNPDLEEGTRADRAPVSALRTHLLPSMNHSQVRHMHGSTTHELKGASIFARGLHNTPAMHFPTEPESTASHDDISDSINADEAIPQITQDDPFPLAPSLLQMAVCTEKADYDGLWDIWHSFAIEQCPRPAELYVAMLSHFAQLGHQAKTMEALRVLVPEMGREEPSVRMDGEVAEAVKRCILAVDPRVEEDVVSLYEDLRLGRGGAGRGEEMMGELQRLWCRCEGVVQEERRWARESDDDGLL